MAVNLSRKWTVTGLAPCVPEANDPNSVFDAMLNRLLRKLPDAPAGMNRLFRQHCRAFFRANFKPVPRAHFLSIKDLFYWWLESRKQYSRKRVEQLRDLWDNVRNRVLRAKDRIVKMFIKHESYETPKHPRAICSRSDAYKCFSGPWIALIEKFVYDESPFFIKHIPVAQRANFVGRLAEKGNTFLSTDFSSFELHANAAIQETCEHQFYSWMLSEIPEAKEFLDIHKHVCTADQTIINKFWNFVIPACRMSGETSTSLGNGITNLCLVTFVVRQMGGKVLDAVVEGDDGLFVMNGHVPTEKEFAHFGLDVRLQASHDLSEAGFCSMYFVETPQGRVMMRGPDEKIVKLAWSLSPSRFGNDRVLKSLLRATALALGCELGKCPIFWIIAKMMINETTGVEPKFDSDGYHFPVGNVDIVEPSDAVRAVYAHYFKVDVSTQLKIEEEIRTCGFQGPLLYALCYTQARAQMWRHVKVVTKGAPIASRFDWSSHAWAAEVVK